MLKSLTKIFQKNTKTCDYCEGSIDPEKDAALCFHGSEPDGSLYEQWICEPCCEKISYEYDEIEEIEVAENRDDNPE